MRRSDFAPWHRESSADSRHPVDDVMANLRQKLGSDIIPKGEWGRGYRLDEKIPVTEIAGPSVKEAERLLREAGCPKINLQVRTANDGVIEFYRRLGYAVDEVVSMGKRLEHDGA